MYPEKLAQTDTSVLDLLTGWFLFRFIFKKDQQQEEIDRLTKNLKKRLVSIRTELGDLVQDRSLIKKNFESIKTDFNRLYNSESFKPTVDQYNKLSVMFENIRELEKII